MNLAGEPFTEDEEALGGWRHASPGLCVEGYCRNNRCAAFGKLTIHTKGLGTFDVVLEASRVFCPLCRQNVEPETFAVSECQWRYSGVKIRHTSGETIEGSGWCLSGLFTRFSEGADKATWKRLLISTRFDRAHPQPKYDLGTECLICLGGFRYPVVSKADLDPMAVMRCGHTCHTSCIEAWKKLGRKTCPQCVLDM